MDEATLEEAEAVITRQIFHFRKQDDESFGSSPVASAVTTSSLITVSRCHRRSLSSQKYVSPQHAAQLAVSIVPTTKLQSKTSFFP